jgi:hypothetical protein
MISHASLRHKRAVTALVLAALAAGCGGEVEKEVKPAVAASTCAVVVNTDGWRDFVALGRRAADGQEVTRAELEALAATPEFTAWRESYTAGPAPTPFRLGNWLGRTFADELGLDPPQKLNADQRAFVRSYRWSWERRELIDVRLGELAGLWCDLDTRLRAWIPATKLPDTLAVVVLPSRPELRYHEGTLYVDTGVVAAGSAAQLLDQLTALTFRSVAVVDGPNPLQMEGEEALVQALRLMANEGVATWLENMPDTFFDLDHPSLWKVRPVPEDHWEIAVSTLDGLDRRLAVLLDDPRQLASDGQGLARSLIGSGSVNKGSWCMAVAIVDVLGEDRLRAAAGSVPGFFAAYQEATRDNNAPRPQLVEVPGAYHRALPPFSPEVWAWLLPLLERHFPGDA